MLVIRPVRMDDLDALEAISGQAGFGLTTLPPDREILRERIENALWSFARPVKQSRGEMYLFVMEDTETGEVAGTSGIASRTGGFDPFYAYRIETLSRRSTVLRISKKIEVLHPLREHNGPCVIGSLFLRPEYRRNGNGRTLSLMRFLFMAQFPSHFAPQVLAEMRGIVDDQGRSPFWEAVGRHFFEMDFPKADYLSLVNKRFITELMPEHPLYIPLLPEEAQAVIGQVHPDTRPAMRILRAEGFQTSNMVDIFEAGPMMTCPLHEIRTVRVSRLSQVDAIVSAAHSNEPLVISNTRRDFRACQGQATLLPSGAVNIPPQVAEALNVKEGDFVRTAPMRGASLEERR